MRIDQLVSLNYSSSVREKVHENAENARSARDPATTIERTNRFAVVILLIGPVDGPFFGKTLDAGEISAGQNSNH
jgi:hypothetical protein